MLRRVCGHLIRATYQGSLAIHVWGVRRSSIVQCGRILDLPRPFECLGSSCSSLSRLPRPLNRWYGVYRPRTSFNSSISLNLRPCPLAQFFVLQTPPGSPVSSVSYFSLIRLSLLSLLFQIVVALSHSQTLRSLFSIALTFLLSFSLASLR